MQHLEYLFCHIKVLESIGDKIAQAQTPIQMHMNNSWSEMISCSPCFAFHCFSSLHWFTQIITTTDPVFYDCLKS